MATNHDLNTNEVEAVVKTVEVIELVKELDGAGVTELANRLGWPKSTVHNHLSTLKREKLIIQEDGKYELGLRFLEFGEYVKNRDPIYAAIEQKIQDLAVDIGERVQFVVEEHCDIVHVRTATGSNDSSDPSKSINLYQLGSRPFYPHATASGKSILAFNSQEYVQRIIEAKGLPKLTPNTITNKPDLFDELDAIRERQYAYNDQEHVEGVQGVGTPILDKQDNVIGAISVAGPAHRIEDERFTEEIPQKLLEIRDELTLNITYM